MPVITRRPGWVSLDPGFARLDARGVEFDDPVEVPRRFSDCCGFVEADDRGIWFLSLDPQTGTDRQLNLFDAASGDVAELAVLEDGALKVAMAVAPDSIWILNYEGTPHARGLAGTDPRYDGPVGGPVWRRRARVRLLGTHARHGHPERHARPSPTAALPSVNAPPWITA